jgi:hypothetical protein
MAHMDLERSDAARSGRVAANSFFFFLLLIKIYVLPGQEPEVLVHRQAQADYRDVRRGLLSRSTGTE